MTVTAYHPGEFIREELETRGWTQTTLANIIGCSKPYISDVVNGQRKVGIVLAIKLAAAFGTSVDLWLNLERSWELSRVDIDVKPIQARAALVPSKERP